MHVVLVGAEFEENLAVRYLRGALEQAGHPVTSVVFNEVGDIEGAAREIVAAGAPLAGFSMVFTYRAREFARLARRVRELGYAGHIVAGGHFAAMHADRDGRHSHGDRLRASARRRRRERSGRADR